MFTGVQILEPRVFDFMIDGAFSITEVTYPRMLAADVPLFGTVFEGPWLTVGTPAERTYAEGRTKTQSVRLAAVDGAMLTPSSGVAARE